MTQGPDSDDGSHVPVVLQAVYGCFATLALIAYVGALWAGDHAPDALPEFFRSLRPDRSRAAEMASVAPRSPLQTFALEIINIDGRIHHAAYASYEGMGGRPEVDPSLVRGLSSARVATPAVTESGQLANGGGIVASDRACFVFDSGDAVVPLHAFATVVYNDTGQPLTAEVGLTDKLGASSPNLALWLRVAGSAAPYGLDAITKDHRVVVRVAISAPPEAR